MLAPCLLSLVLLAAPDSEKPSVSREEVRSVVAAVVKAAQENAAKGTQRLKSDALFDYYVRRAAAAAREQKASPRALLVALGLVMDDTDLLRKNPLAGAYLARLESDAERTRRLKVLGDPTLRKRHDWAMHFAISGALTALLGEEQAERVGIAKELWDAHRESGFSFADLAADLAGIAFARDLLKEDRDAERRLAAMTEKFEGDRVLPKLDDLEDGLPWEQFVKKYGGTDDERFRKHVAEVRRRVLDSPGLRSDSK